MNDISLLFITGLPFVKSCRGGAVLGIVGLFLVHDWVKDFA